ncbi:MAG: hypothetical protein GDA36_03395 [Rhodobacteraceae bacterium]|nr:hypothetical protein [Paracoccaceae bacterium]
MAAFAIGRDIGGDVLPEINLSLRAAAASKNAALLLTLMMLKFEELLQTG